MNGRLVEEKDRLLSNERRVHHEFFSNVTTLSIVDGSEREKCFRRSPTLDRLGVWELDGSSSTDDFDRTGVVEEIDGDILRHTHEEKDRWFSVLIEAMIEDTQVFIAIVIDVLSIDQLFVTVQSTWFGFHEFSSTNVCRYHSSARAIRPWTSFSSSMCWSRWLISQKRSNNEERSNTVVRWSTTEKKRMIELANTHTDLCSRSIKHRTGHPS